MHVVWGTAVDGFKVESVHGLTPIRCRNSPIRQQLSCCADVASHSSFTLRWMPLCAPLPVATTQGFPRVYGFCKSLSLPYLLAFLSFHGCKVTKTFPYRARFPPEIVIRLSVCQRTLSALPLRNLFVTPAEARMASAGVSGFSGCQSVSIRRSIGRLSVLRRMLALIL